MIEIKRILGEYDETPLPSQEHLTVTFSPGPTSRQRHWRKNTLIANFLADYFITFLPTAPDPETAPDSSDPDDRMAALLSQQVELQGQVNFIANELLENAMKFCDRATAMPISLTLRLLPDRLVFEVSNALSFEAAEQFQVLIQELLAEDPTILLLRQLEQNAVEQGAGSRLGFLTMMSDYQARLGWKFEPLPPTEAQPEAQIKAKTEAGQNIYLVTIMVYLKL